MRCGGLVCFTAEQHVSAFRPAETMLREDGHVTYFEDRYRLEVVLVLNVFGKKLVSGRR